MFPVNVSENGYTGSQIGMAVDYFKQKMKNGHYWRNKKGHICII